VSKKEREKDEIKKAMLTSADLERGKKKRSNEIKKVMK